MHSLALLLAACAGTAEPIAEAPDAPPGESPPTSEAPTAPPSTEPEAPAAEPLPICINELVADNEHGWVDETGADPDWIELHNPGADPVDLAGWHLDDHPLDGHVIAAGGFLLLAADGQPELGPNHLGFSLADGGEELLLTAPDGRTASLTYGALAADRALAREVDCCPAGCWIPTMRPTPGGSNAGSLLPSVLVDRGATWAYSDVPQSGWFAAAFDDGGWATGPAPLGYGEPVATEVAGSKVWFRSAFSVADPGALTALRMRLRYDDGAVVYLNGVRIFASGAPEVPTGLATIAREPPVEARWHEAEVWRQALVAGDNVLAAEISQAALDSDDLRFELELRAAP